MQQKANMDLVAYDESRRAVREGLLAVIHYVQL